MEYELQGLSFEPNVIMISETWLDSTIILGSNTFYKYDIFRKDRNKNGGGVLIMCHKSLNAVKLDVVINEVEAIFCEIGSKQNKIILGCIYRSPYYDEFYLNCMTDLIDSISSRFEKHKVIIGGDFNLPYIDWSVPKPVNNDKMSTLFLNCVIDNSYEQIVKLPTRGSNILDLILCKNILSLSDAYIVPSLVHTDHEFVSFSLESGLSTKNVVKDNNKSYDFRKADYISICNYLSSVNWYYEFSVCNGIDDRYKVFLHHINEAIQWFVPFKKFKRKISLPKHIRKLLLMKKHYWRVMKTQNTLSAKEKFKRVSRSCKKCIYDFHTSKVKRLCSSRNLKSFYAYVNSKLGRFKENVSLKHDDGSIMDLNDCVLNFSKFFESVYARDDGVLPNFNLKCHEVLHSIDFDVQDIDDRLSKLPCKYSSGPDNIPTVFLKNLHSVIALPLSLIFQNSLNVGRLPNIWKSANIVPVYKGNGSRFSVENYRPISLTSTVCKVMEGIIYDKIYKHLSNHNLLSASQHGFRKNKSTTSNLLEFIDDVTKQVDDGNNIDVITIDFSKAFDKIPHDKLLHKLQNYGIIADVYSWITSFLKGRVCKVLIGSTISNAINVISSVPQGSNLGPLLYILYTNDLSDIFNYCKIKMYADDLTIYAVVNNLDDRKKVQNELNLLCNWCKTWGLFINFKKCKLIHIGHSNLNFQYTLDNELLMVSQCERILGVLIDNKLSFKDHVYTCAKKASQICNIILANMYNLDNSLLVNLYKTYARPYLEYNSAVFSPHYIELIDVMERVQRRFTKRLHGLSNLCYLDRLNIVKLESLELRRIRNDMITLFKLLHGKIDSSLHNAFVYNTFNTRGNDFKLVKNRSHLNCRTYSFVSRVINVWNSLSNNIVTSSSVCQFVNRLKTFDLTKFIRGRDCK